VLTLVTTALTLALWLTEVYRAVGAGARPRRLLELGHRVCALIILGFTFWGLLLFSNGKFDLSDPVPHATEIVQIAANESELGVLIPFTWMVLRSWEDPTRQDRRRQA